MPLAIKHIVPGGVLPTDHIHRTTNDRTCSRCRKPVPEEEVPIMLWIGASGDDLLIYCGACLDNPEPEGNTDERHT
jgi:hypothetical protein